MASVLGLIIAVVVDAADIQDRDGAELLFQKVKDDRQLPRLQLIWADGGYAGKAVAWKARQ